MDIFVYITKVLPAVWTFASESFRIWKVQLCSQKWKHAGRAMQNMFAFYCVCNNQSDIYVFRDCLHEIKNEKVEAWYDLCFWGRWKRNLNYLCTLLISGFMVESKQFLCWIPNSMHRDWSPNHVSSKFNQFSICCIVHAPISCHFPSWIFWLSVLQDACNISLLAALLIAPCNQLTHYFFKSHFRCSLACTPCCSSAHLFLL